MSPRLLANLLAGGLLLALGSSACQLVFGEDDYEHPPAGGAGPGSASASRGVSASSGSGAAAGSGGAGGSTPEGCTCAATAPEGWESYFQLSSRAPSAPPTRCASGPSPSTLFEGPADQSCTSCSCGAVGGASCSNPKIACYAGSTCGGSATDLTGYIAAGGGNCVPLDGSARSCVISAPAAPSGGGCPTSGGVLTHTAPWTLADDLCQLSDAGGCSEGEVCVAGGACIKKAGSAQCPAAWPKEHHAFTGGPDTRACTACQCQSPQNVQCTGGSYAFFGDLVLCGADQFGTDVSTSACADTSSPNFARFYAPTANAAGASCAPTGGAPTGSLELGQAVTVCCR